MLRQHGDYWADATSFCLRPLDDWLDAAYVAGFFAFRNPAKDRTMANWFIASEPDNVLLVALHQALLELADALAQIELKLEDRSRDALLERRDATIGRQIAAKKLSPSGVRRADIRPVKSLR